MLATIIVLLVLLVASIIITLVIFNVMNKNLNYYKTVSKDVATYNIIQKMFDIMGANYSPSDKIKELNSIIIQTYGIKYSTICLFNGMQHEILATNVEETFNGSITLIAEDNSFRANAGRNVSKYLTTDMSKTLSYKSAVERQIRSAMFSPIYYNDMYLGYWVLEDSVENAFDHISKTELAKLKKYLGVFVENIQAQNIIQVAESTDKQTGFFNVLYLYSNTRQILTANETTALAMINLKNIPDINFEYNRNIGNKFIIRIASILRETITKDAIFVRYAGLKFLAIIPDANAESVQPIMERVLSKVKNEVDYINDEKIVTDIQVLLHTFLKQNNIEKEIQKMVSYIEKMPDVDTIKII